MGEQLSLGRAGQFAPPPLRELVPDYRPAPTLWEIGARLDRIEARLDRLLERGLDGR